MILFNYLERGNEVSDFRLDDFLGSIPDFFDLPVVERGETHGPANGHVSA